MKKDIKQAWLNALRSGDYEQTTGYLEDKGEYCCLGVLCDITDEVEKGNYREFTSVNKKNAMTTCLDADTLEFFGLEENEAHHLMKMNDDELNNFEEIADWIEDYL